jgi:hypothetical protein
VEVITDGWVRVTLPMPAEHREGRRELPKICQLVMPIETLPAEWDKLLPMAANVVLFRRQAH